MSGERNAGGRDERRGGRERPVRDNGVAAFISLWIYMWEGWRGGGREGRT